MLKPTLALAAVLIATALVTPTVSQAATTNSLRVSYADLNLASKVGQHRLQARIAGGARIVCEIEDSRQMDLAAATNACRADAIEGARPAYDAAVAASLHPSVEVLGAASIVVTGE